METRGRLAGYTLYPQFLTLMPAPSPFSPRPRLLDVDGSLRRQHELARLSGAQSLSFAALGSHGRYLCRASRRASFEHRLARQSAPEDRHRLTFYGSGDFHHLTYSLLKFHQKPLSVIVFDQHPDWDVTSPWLCCGTWVNAALRLPNVARIVVLGAGREDLGGVQLWRGNRAALTSGRLEIYPATLGFSLWPTLGSRALPCGKRSGAGLHWKTLSENGWDAVLGDVLARLPTEDVYISVDKDCLRADEAVSNWDAGELELPDVCAAIARIRAEKRLVGADVTGNGARASRTTRFFAPYRAPITELPELRPKRS